MPRRFDADLCRHNGWEPGDILEFGPAAESTWQSIYNYYVLTAIGDRAILCKVIYEKTDMETMKGSGEYKTNNTEQVFRGQLHQHVIRRVGKYTVVDGAEYFAITERLGHEPLPESKDANKTAE